HGDAARVSDRPGKDSEKGCTKCGGRFPGGGAGESREDSLPPNSSLLYTPSKSPPSSSFANYLEIGSLLCASCCWPTSTATGRLFAPSPNPTTFACAWATWSTTASIRRRASPGLAKILASPSAATTTTALPRTSLSSGATATSI